MSQAPTDQGSFVFGNSNVPNKTRTPFGSLVNPFSSTTNKPTALPPSSFFSTSVLASDSTDTSSPFMTGQTANPFGSSPFGGRNVRTTGSSSPSLAGQAAHNQGNSLFGGPNNTGQTFSTSGGFKFFGQGEVPASTGSFSSSMPDETTNISGAFGSPNISKNEEPFPFIFEDGTTRLIVTYKSNPIIGKVSPHALARACPAWKKFIFPPFRKDSGRDVSEKAGSTEPAKPRAPEDPTQPNDPSQTETKKHEDTKSSIEPVEELDFAKDPAEALLILLNIAHLRFTNVPTTLSLDLLSDVAILCDKYDCVHLVKPWMSQWLVRESIDWKPAPTIFGGTIRERWLFIAWVFGREQVFRELSLLLLREIQTSSVGDHRSSTINFAPMPLGIIENILHIRAFTIKKLFEIPKKCIERFANDSHALCKYESKACDATVYGSLLRGLQIDNVDLSSPIDDVHMPLAELAQKLSSLTVHVYLGANSGHLFVVQDHSKCFPTNIKTEVEAVMASINDPVLESHVRHMAAQRAKLSLGVS